LNKKEMKRRMNEIESEELEEYLTKRVVVLTPEEIFSISKQLNSILNE
jgi:hypothetical protein